MENERVIEPYGPGGWMFWCQGCKSIHSFNNTWRYNGDDVKPTVTPSLLTTWTSEEHGVSEDRCHLFIEAGRLRFLADCTHSLAGTTVAMIPVPETWK